jgi:hypothetical protein
MGLFFRVPVREKSFLKILKLSFKRWKFILNLITFAPLGQNIYETTNKQASKHTTSLKAF